MKYKWDNLFDWLQEKVKDWDGDRCRAELLEIARNTDLDTLQDIYQSDMDDDGYFDPVNN